MRTGGLATPHGQGARFNPHTRDDRGNRSLVIDFAELRERAVELSAAGRVGLVGFQTHPARVYRSIDIVVHASTQPEPFGRTIARANRTQSPSAAPLSIVASARAGLAGSEPAPCGR